jgi:hypothetical protein
MVMGALLHAIRTTAPLEDLVQYLQLHGTRHDHVGRSIYFSNDLLENGG